MSNRIQKTPSKLREALLEQISYLKSSANIYDSGDKSEAKRLATTIRVLMHDTKRSKSLLNLLNMKHTKFLDTAMPRVKGDISAYTGLLYIELDSDGERYSPMLDDYPPECGIMMDFDRWWNQVVVIDDRKNELSRKDLVLIAANQDGGAHVDQTVDARYAKLSFPNALPWYDRNRRPFQNPELPAIRQIAHEVLKTLEPGYSKKREPTKGLVMGGPRLVIKTKEDLARERKKVGRNEPCPCGSRRKYKKCCGR